MARWEESRESKRRRLLFEEAETKDKGGLWIKGKDRNQDSYLAKWMSRYQLIIFGLLLVNVGNSKLNY